MEYIFRGMMGYLPGGYPYNLSKSLGIVLFFFFFFFFKPDHTHLSSKLMSDYYYARVTSFVNV